EPENAVHVIQTDPKRGLFFLIPNWWPRILCVDWGYDAMTFAIWAAISPIGRVYIYRTWAWVKTSIKIWSAELVNLSGEDSYEDFVLCHSAGQHKGEEKTIQEQISQAFDEKFTVRLADRDRIGGKNMIHEYLRWMPRTMMIPGEVKFDSTMAAKIIRNK